MIFYRPTDGDVHGAAITWRPRTAFLMTQLGGRLPPDLIEIRKAVTALLEESDFAAVDADSLTTGKDFLLKIWQLALGVPVGIAILHDGIDGGTLANIFYELGLLQAYGKETIIVKAPTVAVPSDFVRTEYVSYDGHFERRFRSFLDGVRLQATYYRTLAEQVENNPLLSIDYLRRAYLICEESDCRDRARQIFDVSGLEGRARNSVESLAIEF